MDISQSLQTKIDSSDDDLKEFVQTLLKQNKKNERLLERVMKLSDSQQLSLMKLNEKMKILSETDKLTSLYNRSKLEDIFIDLLEKNSPFSIMFLDIDNFSTVNEKFNIHIADKVLVQASKIIKQFSRKTTFLGRWSADSFIYIDQTLSLDEMIEIAEEICEKIEHFFFDDVGQVTLSIGISRTKKDSNMQDIVNSMNTTLKKAKNNGKNQVSL